jgi:outer membrane lipoprotein carrier protein
MFQSGLHRPPSRLSFRRSFLAGSAALALSLWTVALPIRAADLPQPETAQLLTKLQEHRAKFPSLTAEFTEEKTSQLLQKPIVSSGTLSFQAPNKFRRELKGSNASTMVSNGQRLWIYYPNLKEAELYALGQRPFFDDAIEALTAGLNFQRVADFYRYTASKEPEGYKLVLTPKAAGLKRILKELTVWVDDNYKIERTIAQLPKGDHVTTIYRNQRPTPVAASAFEFAPPADAHVSQPLGGK